ncbi:MAG: hypothetical protein WCK89_10420 [bacterium]
MAEADPKLNEAIGFFEQMLQTMPGDRMSLEFLAVAYEQTGQSEKRRDCLIRLVDCLLHEKDYDNAKIIAGHLRAFMDYPPACAAIERVAEQGSDQGFPGMLRRDDSGLGGAAQSAGVPAGAAFQDLAVEVHALSHSAAAAEMDLVWLWKEREFLPKEVCMKVLHILMERPATDFPVLISALALLDEQHPEWTEPLMEVMQRVSELPLIPIELFEVSPAAAQLLSPTVIHIKGVLPFAVLGSEVLVAVLNPLSKALQDEVTARIGRPCHFFFAHPKSWLKAVEKIV